MRIKLTVSYDGSLFNGFQAQPLGGVNIKTVAGTLQKALEKLHIQSPLVGSGRTDAGVHASGQIVHCDIPEHWVDLEKLRYYLNRSLEPSIYIRHIQHVPESFNARFDATKRLYRYMMYDTHHYQPFLANYALHTPPLDCERLRMIAKAFEGKHNFSFFKKMGGGKTGDIRTIFKVNVYRHKSFVILTFLGDAFLRSQIRMMTDMILKVHHQELTLEDLILQRDNEKRTSTTLVPACGLYLSKIYYTI